MKSTYELIIVGAGFAGIALAKKAAKAGMEVLLIDRNNYHTFQPLLYQVATGGLEPESIAYPIRRIFRKRPNFHFRMAQVQSIEAEKQCITTDIGTFCYQNLVLATGSQNNFFSFQSIKDKLLPLKSIEEALNLKSFLMQNLERVLIEDQKEAQEERVNIAIVGGGPAGLELAGALAEMRKAVLPKDFPEFDFSRMHIVLFEAGPRLLAGMSEKSSAAALRDLKELGIEVKLQTEVAQFDGHILETRQGEGFRCATVIWTAGVKGASLPGLQEAAYLPNGRILVNAYNQVQGYENVFAIGDLAACQDAQNPRGLPMLAQVAMQQGEHLFANLQGLKKSQKFKPFVYKNKGSMATIGRNRAVVDLPRGHFEGRFAWWLWLVVHLLALVGFRNKIVTLLDWTQNYLNYDRPLGSIIQKYKHPES